MGRSNERGSSRRLLALPGALALAFLTTLALSAPASAAPGNLPDGPGSLTIHKFEQPEDPGDPGDGSEIPEDEDWIALAGVNFTITPITTVDLDTNPGWVAAAAYAADPSTIPPASLGTPIPVVTGPGGEVTQSLPLGAYLVTELPSPAATRPGGAPAHITMTVAPFVVTVPMSTGEGSWITDVHVYPKNSVTEVTKAAGAPTPATPGTPAAGIGSTVPWTVTVQIPRLTDGDSFSGLTVVDALSSKVRYVDGTATVSINGTPVTFTEELTGATPNGGSLEITVTNLTALTAAQGEDLTIVIPTVVEESGEITNVASAFINNPAQDSPVLSNTATSYWGDVDIIKTAVDAPDFTLAGATFTVHLTSADAAGGLNPITVDGVTQFVTADPNGTVRIPGLYIGTESTDTQTYFLREVSAPAGYDPKPTPTEVTLRAEEVDTAVEIIIENAQKPAIELPVTGGAGTRWLISIGCGLALVAVGGALAFQWRRRRAAV